MAAYKLPPVQCQGVTDHSTVPALRGLRASWVTPGPSEGPADGHHLLGALGPLGEAVNSSQPPKPLK